MCGIAGYISLTGQAELGTVRAMCDQIRHRGPDDDGYHVDRECALGMRRLSIIDLAGGHQPIANEDSTLWVVFNGEIYNYQGLRQNLIAQGHRFATNSDTETLLHLYEQEGVAGIERLRGMFGYAIWDARERRLMVARDRFGKKPIYYARTGDGFYFASELKCLRAAGVRLETDDEALKIYLQFGYVPDPWSAFRGVRKLPPGSWLTVDAGGRVKTGTYWKLPPPCADETSGVSEEETCEEIRRLFDESVRLRMIADVPLGAFLSGGIDSSLVVASMARQSSQAVRTFSIGFDESEHNELPWARMVAAQYKTEHHELIVRPSHVELVPRLVRQFDEPFADSSAIPTYLVSEFTAQHVKVALSGDGGDELFGGYRSYFEVEQLARYDKVPQPVRRILLKIADWLPYSAYGKNFLRSVGRRAPIERYFDYTSFNSYYLRLQVLNPEWVLEGDEASIRHSFQDSILPAPADCMSQAMYFEATAKLAGDILVKVDRMSMANSLEVRSPLLDHELAEMANRIPNRWKTREGRGKLILLKALGDRLPAELLSRPKRGFGVPLAEWLRGPLRSMLWDHLTSKTFLERGFTTRPKIDVMLREHDSGRRNNSDFLWLLLILELWSIDQAAPLEAPPKALPLLTSTSL
jgi:asparagine synthase (glutamine-hydrolysing)